MQVIGERLIRIKRELEHKAQKERELNKKVKKVLAGVLGTTGETRYIRGFYLKFNTLFIKTKTKTSANEVFLKKLEILKDLKGLVKGIVVR